MGSGLGLLDQQELLPAVSDRDDQPPADAELLDQGGRHMIGRGGDEDGVEGSFLRQAEVAVPDVDADVSVAESAQGALSSPAEFLQDLDGVDLGRDLAEDRRLAAGPE